MMGIMRLLLCCLAASALAALSHAAERIPGTQVTLDPPEAFLPSSDFPGYAKEDTGASIMINEIPGPFAEVVQGMTAEAMKARGIELVSSEDVEVGGVKGKLLHTRQQAHGEVYEKWLLVFGTDKSVMIHGTAPQDEFAKISDPLRASLLAARWEPGLAVPILEGLPFTIEEAGDLKFAFKSGTTLALTEQGIHPQREIGKPLVVVNVVHDAQFRKDADHKAYATALLQQTAGLPGPIEITADQVADIGGGKGHRVVTSAQPKDAAQAIHYEATVLVEDGRLCLIFGRCSAATREQHRPAFDALCQSFRFKD